MGPEEESKDLWYFFLHHADSGNSMRSAKWATGPRAWLTSFCSLDPFDCREPGRCAVVVESRLNPVWFNGGDIPSTAGVERRSHLFLTDGVRASIRTTIVTETQHIKSPIVLGHRRQTRRVSCSLIVVVEGVKQSAVQHRLETARKRSNWSASAAANWTSIVDPTVAAFSRAMASAVSATSTPRTGNPSWAT